MRTVKTEGEVEIAGEVVQYTVETGTLSQTADNGDEKADVFFIAYRRTDSEDATRPLTFAF